MLPPMSLISFWAGIWYLTLITTFLEKLRITSPFVIPKNASNARRPWLTSCCTINILLRNLSRGRPPNHHFPHPMNSTSQTSLPILHNVLPNKAKCQTHARWEDPMMQDKPMVPMGRPPPWA